MTLRELLVLELMGRVPASEITPERQQEMDAAVRTWMAQQPALVREALEAEAGVVRDTGRPPDLTEVAAKLAPTLAQKMNLPTHPRPLYGSSFRSQGYSESSSGA